MKPAKINTKEVKRNDTEVKRLKLLLMREQHMHEVTKRKLRIALRENKLNTHNVAALQQQVKHLLNEKKNLVEL